MDGSDINDVSGGLLENLVERALPVDFWPCPGPVIILFMSWFPACSFAFALLCYYCIADLFIFYTKT